jgi:hypothetical protein
LNNQPDPKASAYQPFLAARSPGGKPSDKPKYRLLVHRRFLSEWNQLVERVGLESALQFYDHVTQTTGSHPLVGSSTILKGKAGKPTWDGYSRTVHYEISGAGRIDYQWTDHEMHGAPGGPGDEHRITKILTIDFGSH